MHDGSMHSDCKVLGALFGLQLSSPELVGTRSRNQLKEIQVRRDLYKARRDASQELGSEICYPMCACLLSRPLELCCLPFPTPLPR